MCTLKSWLHRTCEIIQVSASEEHVGVLHRSYSDMASGYAGCRIQGIVVQTVTLKLSYPMAIQICFRCSSPYLCFTITVVLSKSMPKCAVAKSCIYIHTLCKDAKESTLTSLCWELRGVFVQSLLAMDWMLSHTFSHVQYIMGPGLTVLPWVWPLLLGLLSLAHML